MSPEIAFVVSLFLLVLMKMMCFLLGYLTIRLGYRLIAFGAKGEFKFSASVAGAKADLASISPGLLFVVLGVFLIGYAIYVDKEVHLTPVEIPQPPEVQPPPSSPFDRERAAPHEKERSERKNETR